MTANQRALLEKAQEALKAARFLHECEQFSFAAATAYYVMFYGAQSLLLGERLKLAEHSAVIAAFGQRFTEKNRVAASFHRYLIEGQEVSAPGDYSTDPVDYEESAEYLRRAEEFLEMAEQLMGATR